MCKIKSKIILMQKGQSLVEFALVLPVFVILLFGIMEFGRLWEVSNVMTSAAREGVRIAAVTAPDQYRVVNAVHNVLSSGGVQSGRNASIQVSGPNAMDEVSVTVSINYSFMSGVIPGLSSINISRSTTMHWEG